MSVLKVNMNRYKFKEADWPGAIKYLKTGKEEINAPNWAIAKKADLKVKGNKIFYKDLEIIPSEKIDDYLRDKIYNKDSKLTFGRDSCFHLLKKSVIGCPRRRVMTFLRSQKTLGETRAAVPQPKIRSGPKLKGLQLQTDLVFVRKNDVFDSNPRFEKILEKKETYILCTTEVASGLCRLSYVETKESKVVTPLVLAHIKWFGKRFKKKPSDFTLRLDKGTEFKMAKLKELVPDTKNVPTGTSVERKNRQIQQCFFRIIKNRQAQTVEEAVRKSEEMANRTMNKYHKKTPDEIVDDEKVEDTVKRYNQTRRAYKAGDQRKPFRINTWVRILVKKQKASLDFKSYKNKTFSSEVYQIKGVTKKKIPLKYRVNGRWYTQDMLLKSAPRDKASIDLVKQRDRKQEIVDFKEEIEKEKVRLEKRRINDARLKALRDADQLMKVREDAVKKLREKLAKKKQANLEIDKLIDEAEAEYQKEKQFTGKKKRIKYFEQPEKDEEWTPDMDKPKKKKSTKKSDKQKKIRQLDKKYQELVRWTTGEENKSYEGPNQDTLNRSYNKNIKDAQSLVKQMLKIKKNFKNKQYFDEFVVP